MTDAERLAEYRAYYRSRADRLTASPLHPESAAVAGRTADAVEAAASLGELQAAAVELSAEAGRAHARDQAVARAAVYAATAEDVRAEGPAEVLARLDETTDGPTLAAVLSDVERRSALAVTADEITRHWTSSITALENIEVWRDAEVPDRWRAELDRQVEDAETDVRSTWRGVEDEAARVRPGWTLDPVVARAERHRRLVPLPDEPFERRLAEHLALTSGRDV